LSTFVYQPQPQPQPQPQTPNYYCAPLAYPPHIESIFHGGAFLSWLHFITRCRSGKFVPSLIEKSIHGIIIVVKIHRMIVYCSSSFHRWTPLATKTSVDTSTQRLLFCTTRGIVVGICCCCCCCLFIVVVVVVVLVVVVIVLLFSGLLVRHFVRYNSVVDG